MIRHALYLTWNRKRQNGLLLLELVGCFLVLFVLLTSVLTAWSGWQRPIGFEPERLWAATGRAEAAESETEAPPEEAGRFLLEAAREHPAVEQAGLLVFGFYTTSGMSTEWQTPGGPVAAEVVPASEEVGDLLDLELEGRWYTEADRHDHHTPVVVNRALADELFGHGQGAVGEVFGSGDQLFRILGVAEHFRKAGELAPERSMFFRPLWPEESLVYGQVTVALRMTPNAPPEAEEELVRRLGQALPTWSFGITRVGDQRRASLRSGVAPLAAGAVVSAFLLLMVGLGLTGVVWQNVSRRTQEIGLRRAQGATRGDIRLQIVLELLVLTLFGVVLGGLVAAQLPLLGLLSASAKVTTGALASAALVLLALTTACGLYPSRLASRVAPAEALQHS